MTLIATLVCHPAKSCLNPELAEKATGAVEASSMYWLADQIACDIPLGVTIDSNSAEKSIRLALGSAPIDVFVQEQDTRRKRALIADMDSTMIGQECIDELAEEAGIKDKVSAITERAMNGEIPFDAALLERVALLKSLPITVIDKIWKSRISLTSGAAELVQTMKTFGAYTALVSGGFTDFTQKVADAVGFDENHANRLCQIDGVLNGDVERPILGRQAKVDQLRAIANSHGIIPSDFLAVGDGANDLGMLDLAGSGVAFHAKPIVAEQARFRVDHGDLTALLYLQGYRKQDIISQAQEPLT